MNETIIFAGGKFGLLEQDDYKTHANLYLNRDNKVPLYCVTEKQEDIDSFLGEDRVNAMKLLQSTEEIYLTVEMPKLITANGKVGTLESDENNVYLRTIDGENHLIYSIVKNEEVIDSFFGEKYIELKKEIKKIQEEIDYNISIKDKLNIFSNYLKNIDGDNKGDFMIEIGKGWKSEKIFIYYQDNGKYYGITECGTEKVIPIGNYQRYRPHPIIDIPNILGNIKRKQDNISKQYIENNILCDVNAELSQVMEERFNSQ